jgi:hypothetical protein
MLTVCYFFQRMIGWKRETFAEIFLLNEVAEVPLGLFGQLVTKLEGFDGLHKSKIVQGEQKPASPPTLAHQPPRSNVDVFSHGSGRLAGLHSLSAWGEKVLSLS